MKSTIGNALSQVRDLGKDIGKSIAAEGENLAKTAAKQVGLPQTTIEAEKSKENLPTQNASQEGKSDQEQFLKELYGTSSKDVKPQENSGSKPPEIPKEFEAKTPQEQQKLMQLRSQLHGKYYQQLTDRPKREEERTAEKVEREKKEEQFEFQEKQKKKPKPLSVQQAANKTERFPGASG